SRDAQEGERGRMAESRRLSARGAAPGNRRAGGALGGALGPAHGAEGAGRCARGRRHPARAGVRPARPQGLAAGGGALSAGGGLPSALQISGEVTQVSLAAGSFARAVQASASAVGQARAKELLAEAPDGHAGAAAGLFALGQGELPTDQLELWKKLLAATCAKHRSAPAAAKRMGMAPPW